MRPANQKVGSSNLSGRATFIKFCSLANSSTRDGLHASLFRTSESQRELDAG